MFTSSISKCDRKCETRNAEPEIGTDGISHTRWDKGANGYWSAFARKRVTRSGFWTRSEPNRPFLEHQTRNAHDWPGPVANTIHGQYVKCRCHHTCKWVSTECPQSVNSALTEHQQSVNKTSTEYLRFSLLHLLYCKGCATAFTYNQSIGDLCGQHA